MRGAAGCSSVIGVRTDDGDTLDPSRIQRQQRVLISQQYDPTLGKLLRLDCTGRQINTRSRRRIIEDSVRYHRAKNVAHGSVDDCLRHPAASDRRDQILTEVQLAAEFLIDTLNDRL